MEKPIYLDNNATTPLLPEVMQAMSYAMEHLFGNPSSSHSLGRMAKHTVDESRLNLANLIGAQSSEIYFTGCATEADNLAVLGLASASEPHKRHLITSAIEHPAIMAPCKYLEANGWSVTYLSVNKEGLVNPDEFKSLITSSTAFASIMHSNNEVGTIQPILEIATIAKKNGIPLHVDAAQSVGKVRVNVDELGADLLTIAGHKFYAPKGIGALYIRKGVKIKPITFGASHESSIRPGTENVIHIAGIGAAAKAAMDIACINKELQEKRDQLHQYLQNEISGLHLNGHPKLRLPNTLNISFPQVDARQMLSSIEDQLCASVGSACHSGDESISGVLSAMGATYEQARGAVRLSVGRLNTNKEIQDSAKLLINTWKKHLNFSCV